MSEAPKLNPTITSQALPPNQRPNAMTTSPAVEVEAQSYDQIVAKPLRAPTLFNVVPKNPNLSGYWGNKAVGEKESTMRYDQLIAMGFRPAKPDEVCVMNNGKKMDLPGSLQKDGRVMLGDTIYLLIPRADYVGATKWNAQTAEGRVRRFGNQMSSGKAGHQSADGREAPTSAATELARTKAGREGKVSMYVPPIAEVDALTADNSGPKELAK